MMDTTVFLWFVVAPANVFLFGCAIYLLAAWSDRAERAKSAGSAIRPR